MLGKLAILCWEPFWSVLGAVGKLLIAPAGGAGNQRVGQREDAFKEITGLFLAALWGSGHRQVKRGTPLREEWSTEGGTNHKPLFESLTSIRIKTNFSVSSVSLEKVPLSKALLHQVRFICKSPTSHPMSWRRSQTDVLGEKQFRKIYKILITIINILKFWK